MSSPITTDEKTIADFGVQWTEFTSPAGWWGGIDGQFKDQLEPLIKIEEIAGKACCDIGSGMGRVVRNLAAAGASHVTAIEPSADAIATLRANTRDLADKITVIHARGDAVPPKSFDFIVSLGVLHHVVDPAPIVRAAHEGLRENGQFLAWLYGREGNRLYLAFAEPLRRMTRVMPLWMLKPLCFVLTVLTDICVFLSRFLPLPMGDYLTKVYGRFDWNKRYLAVFDQLHTTYAKYYTEAEARALFEDNGFKDVRLHHRWGYSWSVIGRRA